MTDQPDTENSMRISALMVKSKLSSTAVNSLQRMYGPTIAHIGNRDAGELKSLRGVGAKGYDELVKALNAEGYQVVEKEPRKKRLKSVTRQNKISRLRIRIRRRDEMIAHCEERIRDYQDEKARMAKELATLEAEAEAHAKATPVVNKGRILEVKN